MVIAVPKITLTVCQFKLNVKQNEIPNIQNKNLMNCSVAAYLIKWYKSDILNDSLQVYCCTYRYVIVMFNYFLKPVTIRIKMTIELIHSIWKQYHKILFRLPTYLLLLLIIFIDFSPSVLIITRMKSFSSNRTYKLSPPH